MKVAPINAGEIPIADVPAGEVRCVFGTDIPSVLICIERSITEAGDGWRLVTCRCSGADGAEKLLTHLVRSLAEAARLLWPNWYDGTIRLDLGTEPAHRTLIDRLVSVQISRRQRGVNSEWLHAALHASHRGLSPFMPRMSLAVQADQLSLALADREMVVAVVLEDAVASEVFLLSFSRGLEWFARETRARVVAVLPECFRSRTALDGISSAAFIMPPVANDARQGDRPEEFEEEKKHLICPILGRPHPASPGEQKLAASLTSDAELSGLFRFNERVTTVFGNRFLVDLVWPAGRVIVEVDGYGHHSTPAVFHSDRHRDYELTLSGYLVLRLPHDDVVADAELAVERIREFVSFRVRHPFIEAEVTA